ncbi:ATP-binding cassette domain-containing protein [Streptomyces sp. NPDC054863]
MEELLERVGLAGMGRRRTWELSGGQQQRVAIARALSGAPGRIVAELPVDLPRDPGTDPAALRATPEFARLRGELTATMREAATLPA